MGLFDWLWDWFLKNRSEGPVKDYRKDFEQSEELNLALKNELALSAGREGKLQQQLQVANATIEEKNQLLTELEQKLTVSDDQVEQQDRDITGLKSELVEAKLTIENREAERDRFAKLSNDMFTQFTSPYSQDISGLLATMLKGDSAQALTVANKTLLAFDLVKAIHAYRMTGQVVQWEEQDVMWLLQQLQVAHPGSKVLTWQPHEGVWIYPPKDGLYRVLKDRASLQTILDSGFGVLMPYIKDLLDCDDFAKELSRHGDFWWLVNSLLYAESFQMRHAYTVVPLATEVVVVEPQNNRIMSLAEAKAAGYLTSDIYP